jgi:hypothetical protein
VRVLSGCEIIPEPNSKIHARGKIIIDIPPSQVGCAVTVSGSFNRRGKKLHFIHEKKIYFKICVL